MKTRYLILFILGLLIGHMMFGQEDRRVPVWQGCEYLMANHKDELESCFQKNLNAHVRHHFTYPKYALIDKREGKVYVRFIIGKDGYITEITASGGDGDMRDEATRIVKLIPQPFIPAYKGKERVALPFTFPITFGINYN